MATSQAPRVTQATPATEVPPLGGYIAKYCPRRVQLDLVKPGEPLEQPPDVQKRIDDGIAFEAGIVDECRRHAQPDWEFIDEKAWSAQQIEATRAAVEAGASVIVGARLPDDTDAKRSGAPDLLVKEGNGYIAVDVKHHLTLDEDDDRGDPPNVSELADPTPGASEPRAGTSLRRNKDDALQLAHYRRLLDAHGWASDSSLAGIIGKERLVAWYDLDAPMWLTPAKSGDKKQERRSTMEVYEFEFEFRLDMAAEALDGQDLLPPVSIGECKTCGWREHCTPLLEAGTGDPSLLPRIGYRHWRALRDAGITDRAAVARLDYPTAKLAAEVDLGKWLNEARAAALDDPRTPIEQLRPRAGKQAAAIRSAGVSTAGELLSFADPATAALGGAGFVHKAILNARAVVGSEPVYRRPGAGTSEVPRADLEIDIDMENTEDGVYLWGAFVTDRADTGLADEGYRPFDVWSELTAEAELANFERFWSWLTGLISRAEAEGFSVMAYCWHAGAENTQLRRIAESSADLAASVEAFIGSSRWVDLEAVFKRSWMTGTGTSLKEIAPLAGFSWEVDDPGGAMSMVKHDDAAAGDAEAQRWLTDYNSGDVEATLAIREWLDREGGAWPEVPL